MNNYVTNLIFTTTVSVKPRTLYVFCRFGIQVNVNDQHIHLRPGRVTQLRFF